VEPMANQDIFLTKRQVEVLKMRKKGLTQEEIAKQLKTTRANVSILERRAYDNVKRAKATLETVNRLEIPTMVTVLPNTIITDIPRLILDKADDMGVKIKGNCMNILETVIKTTGKKIKRDHVYTAITIEIMPNGTFYVK
jgi:Tfx family DNA-binding protein